MKKISIALMVIVVFLAGCVSFEIGGTEKELVAKIAARHLANEIQKRYPVVAAEILVLSKEILIADENIIEVMIDQLTFVLSKMLEDPIIAMDIKDIVELIIIKPDVEITPEQIKIIKSVVSGLIQGFEG